MVLSFMWKHLLSLVKSDRPDFSRLQVRAALRYRQLVRLYNYDREELMSLEDIAKKGPPESFKLTSKGRRVLGNV